MSDFEEKARRLGVPLIPPKPKPQPPGVGNPVVAVCGACGREIFQIDSYCCQQDNCPFRSNITC